MSTIVRQYTSDGFVIASDGRGGFSDGREPIADCQKIFCFPSAPNLAFSFVGTVQLGSAFSFFDTVRSTLPKLLPISVSLMDYALKLSYVVRQILTALRSQGWIRFTEDPSELFVHSGSRAPNFTIAYVLIDGYFRGVAGRGYIRFSHENQRISEPEWIPIPLSDAVLANGSAAVVNIYETDPRFGSYRNYDSKLHQSLVLSRAANLAKGLVEAQGGPEGRALDAATCATIGGRTHIAIITPTEGFSWIPGFGPA